MKSLWRNFFTGMLVILPAALTVLILQFLFGWVMDWVVNPLTWLLTPWIVPSWAFALSRLTILVGFILGVAVLGWGTRILIVRRLLHFGEQLFRRVPLVGTVYGTIRDIANTFTGTRAIFKRVVLVEWPRPGTYAIGFVTSEGKGEVQAKTPEEVLNVFIPTTPNPTSGYLILADRNRITPLEMSVEEGMKLVISGGVVGPAVKLPQPPPSSSSPLPGGG